jgi:DNA primase
MDTLMCHQAGYTNAVASSGTALTEKQLEQISRISPKMVIAYDSDSAGFKAAEKAWQMALSLGIDVKIAPIPAGNDPADIIKDDLKKWKEVIKSSKHIIEVLIDKIKESESDKRKIHKEVSERVIPYLNAVESKIDADHFVTLISEEFGIDKGAITEEVSNYKSDPGNAQKIKDGNNIIASQTRTKDDLAIEKRLIGLIRWQQGIKNKDEVAIDSEKVEKSMKEIVGDRFEEIVRSVNDSIEDIMFTLENSYSGSRAINGEKDRQIEIVKKDADELLINLKIKYLTKEREQLLLSLRAAEKASDEKEENKLLKKIGEISKEIQKINEKTLI